MNAKFQTAVSSRIIGVERTVWFQCKVIASTLLSETSSYLPNPTRVSLEVEFVSVGTYLGVQMLNS